jgi:Predicted permeases
MPTDGSTLLLLVAALLATGLTAGFLAGLLGIGGGIVVVPVLVSVFAHFGVDPGVAMHMAVGTSLGAMVPTSIMSARSHHKRGAVELDVFKRWAPAVVVGVVLGTLIAGFVRGQVLTALFGIVALLVAINMVVRGEARPVWAQLPEGLGLQAIAAAIGLISSMMGIGGGMLSVPVMSACSYPIRQAVGTAAATGTLIALPGAIGFILSGWGEPGRPPFSLGFVSLVGFALIVPATVLAAPFGAKVAHTINARWLRLTFVVFLFFTGGRMLWRAFG